MSITSRARQPQGHKERFDTLKAQGVGTRKIRVWASPSWGKKRPSKRDTHRMIVAEGRAK